MELLVKDFKISSALNLASHIMQQWSVIIGEIQHRGKLLDTTSKGIVWLCRNILTKC